MAKIDLDAVPVGHFAFDSRGEESEVDGGFRSKDVSLGVSELGFGQAALGFEAVSACGEE